MVGVLRAIPCHNVQLLVLSFQIQMDEECVVTGDHFELSIVFLEGQCHLQNVRARLDDGQDSVDLVPFVFFADSHLGQLLRHR